MTTMEKPQSKKAKKFNFSGTQDHGDAAQRKGHQADGYYWETRYDQRGKINADKTYLKEVIRDGLTDEPTPAELEAEADRILAEAGAGALVTEYTKKVEVLPKSVPTLNEAGGRTSTEVRKSMARAATLDAFEDDDFGDYNGSSHIRISNGHPYDKK